VRLLWLWSRKNRGPVDSGTLFAGMTLKWNYSPIHAKCSCHLSMPGYIFNVCTRYKHPMPTKHQPSPHKHCEIIFGQTTQLTHVDPYRPPLSTEGVKRIQGIIGVLLYYACAVDNKLLATLITLSSQQATATEATNVAMNQLLDYMATYPGDGTTYHACDMILCAHADAGFYNESKGRSQANAHIFISKRDSLPQAQWSGSLNLPDNEVCHVFCRQSRTWHSLHHSQGNGPPLSDLIKMGWLQPRTPIQTDKSTAVGATNFNIVPQKNKSMDLRLWWLCCQESQQQFRYYWDKVSHNWADYHTKHHPPIYHKANRPIHAGAAAQLP
jgi:hypothetical protein